MSAVARKPASDGRDDEVSRPRTPAICLVVLLALTWSWWAWQKGAYFGTVLLPGLILLCVGTALLLAYAPWPGSLRHTKWALLAVASLVALGGWTALSAFWSPAPDVAVTDGQRVLCYALVFALGLWLGALTSRRSLWWCLLPLFAAGAFAATITVAGLLTSTDLHRYLYVDGTLWYPLGYRNANAAFFLIALWPSLALASNGQVDWRLRAVSAAVATLCLDLGVLCQSRASVAAALVALLVWLLASRAPWNALTWTLIVGIPAALVVPSAVDLHAGASDGAFASLLDEMREAGRATVLSAAIALAVGGVVARFEPRVLSSWRRPPSIRAAAIRVVTVISVAVLGALLITSGHPISWLNQRAAQFGAGQADLSGQQLRFSSFQAGTDRGELWRIALDEGAEHPLLGDGAGGYRFAYLREHDQSSPVALHDAHSVELETFSQLGLPGLALLLSAIGAAFIGILQARRLGPGTALVAAGSLAAGAYWLVHSSVDWFWSYPVLSAPVLALMGSAAAHSLAAAARRRRSTRYRRALMVALAALAVSAVPFFLSQRYVDGAYSRWQTDFPGALSDLDHAETLDPMSIGPILARGGIAKSAHKPAVAIPAFREAAAKRPEEWTPHYFLALLLANRDPQEARRQARTAERENPHDPDVEALMDRIKTP